jgi:hypothetical protein
MTLKKTAYKCILYGSVYYSKVRIVVGCRVPVANGFSGFQVSYFLLGGHNVQKKAVNGW